jgi:hypothetical protein
VQAGVLRTLGQTTLAELVDFHARQIAPAGRAGQIAREPAAAPATPAAV